MNYSFAPKIILLILAMLTVLTASSNSQEQSGLIVTVYDQNGGAIATGVITLRTLGTNSFSEIVRFNSAEIIFAEIPIGKYELIIESPGFQSQKHEVNYTGRRIQLQSNLKIEKISIKVNVERSRSERTRDRVFDGFMTEQEISLLPENPNEIADELRMRFGDDIVIRVNGFEGGVMPPKEFISSIKINRNRFDAEYHTVGKAKIDIRSKAGSPRFYGFIGINYSHSALGARNPLSSEKLPMQAKNIFAAIMGPLIKNKISFTAALISADFSSKPNIIAVQPGTNFQNRSTTVNKFVSTTIGFHFNLNKSHGLNIKFARDYIKVKNGGVGGISLPEFGFQSKTLTHTVKLNESGILFGRLLNEFQFEIGHSSANRESNSSAPGLVVSQTLNSGGSGIDNTKSLRKLNIADTLGFGIRNHNIKIGGGIAIENLERYSADGANGSFLFPTLAQFVKGRAILYSQRVGFRKSNVTTVDTSLFIQDDIRIFKSFQLGIGLRYELQNTLRDKNNLAPRFSFTFSPSESRNVVFRGGAGIYYQWNTAGTMASVLSRRFDRNGELIILNPGFPDPFTAGRIRKDIPPGFSRIAKNLVNPITYIAQTVFSYRLSDNATLDSAYTFLRGTNQHRTRDLNSPIEGLRPNAAYGRIMQMESSGNFSRHSIVMRSSGSIPPGIGFGISYTISKTVNDYEGVFELPSDNSNLTLDQGPSSLDQRHVVAGRLSFTLFDKLRILPMFRASSPTPYSITTGADDNRDTVFNDRPPGVKRNSARGSWFRQTDLTIGFDLPIFKRKEFRKIKEEVPGVIKNRSIGIDITIQNLFNDSNFSGFVGNQLSTFFRKPTASGPARSIRFGLRFMIL